MFPRSDGFASRDEATQTQRRLTTFFKEVLLPLAAETNAIVLCSAANNDALSTTLAETMPLFTAKFGGKLPFTVLAMNNATMFERSMLYRPDSLACDLANKSKNWRKAFPKFEALSATKHRSNRPVEKRHITDAVPNLVNYIICEGVSGRSPDTWDWDTQSLLGFQNELLQALAAKCPTLCVRTGASGYNVPLTPNVDLASRNIPVLMVDTQMRPTLGVTIDQADPSGPTPAELVTWRDKLITKAIEQNLERHRELWALGKVQPYDQHDLAWFHDVLCDDGDANTAVSLGGGENASNFDQSLYESLRHAETAEESDSGGRGFTPEQLERVINHMVEMMAQGHIRVLPAEEIEKLAPGFDPKLPELLQKDFDPMEQWAKKMTQIWSVYYDIYQSKQIYGVNLQKLSSVKNLIDGIVKRDRLPTRNSLESQQLLRSAWNAVDICTHQAAKYKRYAKFLFLIQLLLGLVVILLTMFRDDLSEASSTEVVCPEMCVLDLVSSASNGLEVDLLEEATSHNLMTASTGTFITASILTLVTGMTTFLKPAQRWRELRAAAESLQSEIFRYRTRTGPYTVVLSQPTRPEQALIEKIKDSRTSVVQMGGLSESSFQGKYPSRVFRHGQNKPLDSDQKPVQFDMTALSVDSPIDLEDRAIVDNHHSPMKPSQYISARLVPMLDYYQSLVPQKDRVRTTTAFVLLAATCSIAVLSFLSDHLESADLSAVAGVISGVSASIVAWQEFSVSEPPRHVFVHLFRQQTG